MVLSKLEPLLVGIRSLFDELNIPQPKFSVVTNGTLITSDAAALFRRYQIYTTVSLDGTGAIHDATRNQHGKCTYQIISENLKLLDSQHLTVEFSVTHVLIEQYRQGRICLIASAGFATERTQARCAAVSTASASISLRSIPVEAVKTLNRER